ncbi:MAG: hypothetical protein VX777_04770 [Chlamydiota bacterium]|nr:hypothetical protein [Chlamydiota bacterium]
MLNVQDIRKHIFGDCKKDPFFQHINDKNYSIKIFDTYGKHDGFFKKLGNLIDRIWNAIKAIFGRSTWQVAKKTCIKESDKTIRNVLSDKELKDSREFQKLRKQVMGILFDFMGKLIINASHCRVKNVNEIDTALDLIAKKQFKNFKSKIDKITDEEKIKKRFGEKYTNPQTPEDELLKEFIKKTIETLPSLEDND